MTWPSICGPIIFFKLFNLWILLQNFPCKFKGSIVVISIRMSLLVMFKKKTNPNLTFNGHLVHRSSCILLAHCDLVFELSCSVWGGDVGNPQAGMVGRIFGHLCFVCLLVHLFQVTTLTFGTQVFQHKICERGFIKVLCWSILSVPN